MHGSEAPELKRVLHLRDLLIYGMIILQVVGPLPTFGLLAQRSNNHAVATAVAAMLPMLITALSYGRMARMYPMAGSAYTYVGRSLSPHLGFLIGWSMFLDYWMILMISALIPALAIQRLVPALPLTLLTLVVLIAMTAMNLRGIRTTLRANKALLIAAALAVAVFVVLAARYLLLKDGPSSAPPLVPLNDILSSNPSSLLSGISLAAITYIGFDALSTLAEDSVNPKRDMVLAPVLVVLITGVLCVLELYFLTGIVPDWRSVDPNTAYLDAMRLLGGSFLFITFLIVMSVSQFGSGFSVQVGVARLLYGMGRDNVLPQSLFGYLSPKHNSPSRNILFVGVIAYVGTLFISFEQACDLLNFGAFLGFMGVNIAVVFTYYVRPPATHRRNVLLDLLLPVCGFLGCLIFWIGLPIRAKILGGLWLLAGLAYCAYKTRGFRDRPLLFNFQER
jgi:amino acid transporter